MKTDSSLFKKLKTAAPVRLVVCSFALVILLGAALLMLPACSRGGEPTRAVDALFTAVSATCVTGLVVFDTWSHWNALGQAIILFLIQIGGLGVITFTTGFTLLLRHKLGLREVLLASENTGGDTVGIYRLIKMILAVTFLCEGTGAMLLMLRFVPKFGAHGVWIAVFEAVSAYCNAGFDILGFERKDGSLINYVGDPLVCVTIALLIIIGGLGFVVISNVYYARVTTRLRGERPAPVNFHSLVVLVSTAVLLALGTVLFFFLEYDNTMRSMDFATRLNASFFQSASARTAGFASIDIAGEHDFTKLVTVILMFIGASPASTGGGIKTTTLVVMLATVFSVMRGSEDTVLHKWRIDQSVVYRALTIFIGALFIVLSAAGVILSSNPGVPVSGIDALFEATSAFGTVGLTAGLTPKLSDPSKLALIFAMFAGRVGLVSLALAVTLRRGRGNSAVLPEGRILVG